MYVYFGQRKGSKKQNENLYQKTADQKSICVTCTLKPDDVYLKAKKSICAQAIDTFIH